MANLTEQEFVEVTKTWIERLGDQMSTAGCNDVYPDEFPQSVCDKFCGDGDVFDAWKDIFCNKTGISLKSIE